VADAPNSSATLKGVLERILFFNEENHYCVAEFLPGDGGARVTIVGLLPGAQCGETLILRGQWTRHPHHGEQFKVESFRSELPATVYGIRKYLGSGLVPGIGKVYAEKIVDKFGLDTLRVLNEESGLLRTVPGIGKLRAQNIKQAWDEQRTMREVMVFLQTYGVTAGQCSRIVQRYGHEAKFILQNEPYRVAREIDGIGFKTADKIALNLGLANDGAQRLDAGLLFAMGELEEEGHTAYPESELIAYAAELLDAPADRLAARIDVLIGTLALAACKAGPENAGQRILQLPHSERAESRIAESVRRLQRVASGLPPIKVDAAVQWAQDRAGFEFNPHQAEALRGALRHKLFILTGGPGTGKTTILRALVEILKAKQARVSLAAPTGRAAQRLAESARGYAQTIHRLLKFDPARGGFTTNRDKPLAADVLIIDEASMLDARLAAALLDAVPSAAHVVLVGDIDQLPSVGAGNVLSDLIQTGSIPVARLSAIYRQSARSGIISAAHAINRGEVAMPPAFEQADEIPEDVDFALIRAETPDACLEKTLALAANYLPRRLKLDPIRDVQALVPMHKGIAGVGNFNQRLQRALNDTGGLSGFGGFQRGDKVIQLRNNYDKDVFNGDIGLVVGGDGEAGELQVEFDGQRHAYTRADIGELALAYAITIHKSQGSEYPVVIVPLLKQHFLMLQRNLIYTAITRGKRRVYIVGDPAAYAMAVRNGESKTRCTRLREKLAAALAT
jgi:exodeoxyribonuclease V alpha subunit